MGFHTVRGHKMAIQKFLVSKFYHFVIKSLNILAELLTSVNSQRSYIYATCVKVLRFSELRGNT